MRRIIICLMLPLLLAACGAQPIWAPDEAVERAAYSSGESPSITLFTVISTRNGTGGHSALLIDGNERVLFDPAGSWYHDWVPERNDVHYGITPQMRTFYIEYHVRETYYVREQKVPVSLDVAEMVRARAEAYGAVPRAFCAVAVSSVLGGVPGFAHVPSTFAPLKISAAFAQIPGEISKDHYFGDPANVSGVAMILPEPQYPSVTSE
jgi:hypothetical protein